MNATNRGLKPIIYSVRSDNDCAIFACVGCRSVRLYKRIVWEVSGVNVNDAIISTKNKMHATINKGRTNLLLNVFRQQPHHICFDSDHAVFACIEVKKIRLLKRSVWENEGFIVRQVCDGT